MAGSKRNLVDSGTICSQREGSSRAARVLQPDRGSKQLGQVVRRQRLIGAMLRMCGWIESGTRGVLEQVVAIGDECPRNVRATMSTVTGNYTVTYRYQAELLGSGIFNRDVSTNSSSIVIDGTKDEVS